MSVENLIESYYAVWNERDAEVRRELMASVLTEDATYADPDYELLTGHAELSDAIGRAHEKFGELAFTLGSVVDAHHHRALATWKLGEVATGYNVVEFTGDRISGVTGFFG